MADAKPDPLMQEIVRLRASNQAATRETNRLRGEVSDKEFECQQLDKTIRKLERKIEALEDSGTKQTSSVSKGFFKPVPAGSECPPPDLKAPQPKPKPSVQATERSGRGVIIDAATGEEVIPKNYWPEEEEEEGDQQNILLRSRGHRPEMELMHEMRNPIEINPQFDTKSYANLLGEGKKEEAEAMIRNQGGPTLEQMQRAPLEVLRKYPGLDPNWCDPAFQGCSLLQWACSMGFDEVASQLLEMKAEPGHRTTGGMTALASSCSRNWPDCARLLLTHRASPDDIVDSGGGQTLLMWASRIEYCDEEGNEHLNPYVAMLLEHHADPEVTDHKGKTALTHASTEGNVQVVQALLDARADVDAQDSDGNTPWQISLKYCHGRISSMLLPRRKKRAGTEGSGAEAATTTGTGVAPVPAAELPVAAAA